MELVVTQSSLHTLIHHSLHCNYLLITGIEMLIYFVKCNYIAYFLDSNATSAVKNIVGRLHQYLNEIRRHTFLF